MNEFVQHNWDLNAGSNYTVSGEVDVVAFDNWFKEHVYGGGYLAMRRDLEYFLLLLRRMHQADKLPGYNFLFEMPEYDREEWVENAYKKLARLHKEDPDAFPADGIVASFDRLRAWRKAKSKSSKVSRASI